MAHFRALASSLNQCFHHNYVEMVYLSKLQSSSACKNTIRGNVLIFLLLLCTVRRGWQKQLNLHLCEANAWDIIEIENGQSCFFSRSVAYVLCPLCMESAWVVSISSLFFLATWADTWATYAFNAPYDQENCWLVEVSRVWNGKPSRRIRLDANSRSERGDRERWKIDWGKGYWNSRLCN